MGRTTEILNSKNIFSMICAASGTLLSWLFGEWDMVLKIVATLMCLDYITGVIVAYINKEIDSKIGIKGIFRKTLNLVLIIIGVLLDRLLGSEWTFRSVVCYFMVGNEGWSIVENIAKAGVPIPNKIRDVLAQLRNEEGINK